METFKNMHLFVQVAKTSSFRRAAEVLEKEGIQCNLTLLFSFAQARACAEAGAFLISPFVGRILDWYKAKHNRDYTPSEDPGVVSVTAIYDYYKQHDYPTVVMGASFRNVGQIVALAGCDLLTISPDLLALLAANETPLTASLDAQTAKGMDLPLVQYNEAGFRFALNEDAMATEKLAEGIRAFCVDAIKLEGLMQAAQKA
jgi:transaldolase